MKELLHFAWISILSVFLLSSDLFSQPADTLMVQTFTFSDPSPIGFSAPYRGTFKFPDQSETYSKILMIYTLKCDQATNQDGFPCGEWDYLTYTYVVDSSGVMDSTFRTNPNYALLGGGTPDSIPYSLNPAYLYFQKNQYSTSYTDTISLNNVNIGTGIQAINFPFSTASVMGRSQFLWKANEMTTTGLSAGDITGIKLNLTSIGTEIRNLTIRIKQTSLDSLDSNNFENNGFTEVYKLTTDFINNGWQDLNFYSPFNWDGSSNLVLDFSFENLNGGIDNQILSENTGFKSGVNTFGNDQYLDFDGNSDFANAGSAGQITGSNPRTIEAWAYTRSFNGGGIFQAGPVGTTGADFSLRTTGTNETWRVQLWGTPDFDVNLPGSKDSWHHYCLTFDGNVTKIYYDGQLIQQDNTNLNTGVHDIIIGKWRNSEFDGKIDEFRVWNTVLDSTTIAEWMHKSLDNSHPHIGNLTTYYPFDEGNGYTSNDQSGNGGQANFYGMPDWGRYNASDFTRNISELTSRPNIIFEQGLFSTTIDTLITIDSFALAPDQLIGYNNPSGLYQIRDNNPNHPSIPTDTTFFWTADRYLYIYDESGLAVDSVFFPADKKFIRNDHRYFSNIVRYEIGRYITPYGINLDLGIDGTTWIFDVTDYAPLLHDWVYLQAGNNQELLDLKFMMIKGTPPRDVKAIENLWTGSFSYNALFNDTRGEEVNKYLDPQASMFQVKTRTSGHGFGGPSNCAEFCPRFHHLLINGNKEFEWELWTECGDNFVYPQGGTWVYDRAGWCPGAIVRTYEHEITSLVNPGDSVTIDYGIEDPDPFNPEGNYVLQGQLFTYDAPNYQTEVAIEEIISPNSDKRFSRRNPICKNPKIRIKNNGSDPLTQVLITYGVENGFMPCYFFWEGNLDFLESEEIELPLFNWTFLDPDNPVFYVSLSNPNGKTDEKQENNYLEVPFEITPQFVNGWYLEVRTNGVPEENSYTITDMDGNIVIQRDSMLPFTIYRDTLDLPNGCYTFHFRDDNVFSDFDGNDGISWWANNDGNGYVRWFDRNGVGLKTYNPDFGSDIYEEFTIGYYQGQIFEGIECDENTSIELKDEAGSVNLFPNPTTGKFNLEFDLPRIENIDIYLYNTFGKLVFQTRKFNISNEIIEINQPLVKGAYIIKINTSKGIINKKLIVN